MARPASSQTCVGFACLENVRLLNIVAKVWLVLLAGCPPARPRQWQPWAGHSALPAAFPLASCSPSAVTGCFSPPTRWTSVASARGTGAAAPMLRATTARVTVTSVRANLGAKVGVTLPPTSQASLGSSGHLGHSPRIPLQIASPSHRARAHLQSCACWSLCPTLAWPLWRLSICAGDRRLYVWKDVT